MTYLYMFLSTCTFDLYWVFLLWCLPFWPIFGSNRDQSEDEEIGNANVIVLESPNHFFCGPKGTLIAWKHNLKNGPTQAAQGFLFRNRGTLGGNKHISKAIQNKEGVLLVRLFVILSVALWAKDGLKFFKSIAKYQ